MSPSPLITSWTEYAAVAERLLGLAQRTLVIFDRNLLSLHLERPTQIASLTRFLRTSPMSELRIAVHSAEPLRNQHPRLLDLLRSYAHKFHVQEIPPHLSNLSDSMLIADGESALIRFHCDYARSKEIAADTEACKPYVKRFEDIWSEGGSPVSATVAGL
jgi:hypothetical protein